MAIIMIDCDDCYLRADKFGEMSKSCTAFAAELCESLPEHAAKLSDFAERFSALEKDIRASTDIWADFYRRNIRL